MKLNLPHILAQLDNVNPDDSSWFDHAECRGMDPALFIPERGDIHTLRYAQQTCVDCPVRWNCLSYGLNERIGIWGGYSEKQRRAISVASQRHFNRPGRSPKPIVHGTTQGYWAHNRRGEDPCPACREAWGRYNSNRKRTGRAS